MDIARGIEVLAKKDFLSDERPLRLIGHPNGQPKQRELQLDQGQCGQTKKGFLPRTPTRAGKNAAKPTDFCQGHGNPGMEWKCKRPTSTGQPRQERCSKGRTDALKDVMGLGLGLGLALWYGKKIREGACALWKKKKNGGFPAPRSLEEEAAYYPF